MIVNGISVYEYTIKENYMRTKGKRENVGHEIS